MHLWLRMGSLIKILQSLCHVLWRTLKNEKLKSFASDMRFLFHMKTLQLILWNIYHLGFNKSSNLYRSKLQIRFCIFNYDTAIFTPRIIYIYNTLANNKIKLCIPFHQPTKLHYMNIHNNSFSTMKIICSKTFLFLSWTLNAHLFPKGIK